MIVAFVDAHGSIQNISHLRSADGLDLDDPFVIPIYSDIDAPEMMATKYWDGNTWAQRSPRPGYYYYWANARWHLDEARLLTAIRDQRNEMLIACDWTQMPDAPLTEQQRTAWAIYRQSLRDVPQNNANVASLDEVQWPSKPEA